MGLSSKKTKTTSNQTATTTPNLPGNVQAATTNYFDQLQKLNPMDNIAAYQTPLNAQQTAAGQSALGLGGTQGLTDATAAANAAANRPAPTATAQQAQVGNLGQAAQMSAALVNPSDVAMAQAGQVGPAAQAALATAQAAQLGNAQTVNLGGYNAAQAGPVQFANPVAQAQAASMLDGFDKYQNPATQNLVDATMASYDDQAGRAAAQLKAQGAKAGAFGGSRFGIAEAQFAADTGRNRALTDAQLRDNAFRLASANAQFDAGNRQQTGLFNAGEQNTRTNLGAQLTTANNQFNAGQTNDASRFTADARNQGSLFNANARNDFAKTNAGFQQQTNLFNAGEANTTNRFNAGETNQNNRTQAGLDTSVNVANTGARNQGLFANQAAQNSANQFNAGSANQFSLADFAARNNASSQNAALGTQTNQFNAGQQADQIARQLQAASLASQNAVAGANIQNQAATTQANIGNSLWDVQSRNNMMPLATMQAYGGMINPGLINAISGQTVNSNGTQTGKSSGSLFDSLLAGASLLPF